MKNIFRKAITVLGSAVLIGATVGAAAAASYPSPFTSNTAVVVSGSLNAAPLDLTGATTIMNDLTAVAAGSVGGSTTVTGGDSYMIQKSSDSFNLGDSVTDILPEGKLDLKDFPTALADGIYEDDNDVEYDFNQKVYVANENIELIVDKDYKDKDPTLGIYLPKEGSVMTYNITFEDTLNMSAMATTDLTIAGKDYYVLSADSNTVELLDTASTTLIAEGENVKVTVGGVSYEVSVAIYSDGAIFTVNGEESKQLATGDYDKLTDDVYLVAKSVRYATKESGVSRAEFSLGKGKITLEDGDEVKVNTDAVKKLYADVSSTAINFRWLAEEEAFLTGASGYSEVTMPLFGAFKLVFGGVNFPATTEDLELVSSEDYISLNAEIAEGSLSLPILYRDNTTDTTFSGLGEDAENRLAVNGTNGNAFNVTLNEAYDTSFVVTYIKGEDAYTYAFQLDNVDELDGDVTVLLNGITGEDDVQFDELNDYVDLADITLTLVGNQTDENATIQVSTSVSGGTVYGDRVVTVEGLQAMIPSLGLVAAGGINGNTTATPAYNQTSWTMAFTEEDKDGDIAAGNIFTATIVGTDEDGIHASGTGANVTMVETLDADNYVGYVFSDLASKVEMDKSGDTNTFVVKYNGAEVTANVYIATGDATVGNEGGDTGVKVYKDSEASSFAGMNLVVVGGSAINSIAAELLTSAYSEGAFTTATGVSAGQFLIQSFSRSGKTALLVAGYNAADTDLAVRYLTNSANTVDTTVGKKYIGTSATQASLVVA